MHIPSHHVEKIYYTLLRKISTSMLLRNEAGKKINSEELPVYMEEATVTLKNQL